jgi:hypothetical protein
MDCFPLKSFRVSVNNMGMYSDIKWTVIISEVLALKLICYGKFMSHAIL